MAKAIKIEGSIYTSKAKAKRSGMVYLSTIEQKYLTNFYLSKTSFGVPTLQVMRKALIDNDLQWGSISILRESEGVWNVYKHKNAVSGFVDNPLFPI